MADFKVKSFSGVLCILIAVGLAVVLGALIYMHHKDPMAYVVAAFVAGIGSWIGYKVYKARMEDPQ